MKANIKKLISGFIVALALLAVVPAVTAGAQSGGNQNQTPQAGGNQCNVGFTFFPRWYDNGLCENGKIKSPGDFGNDTASSLGTWASKLALNIVSMLLVAVGYVSLGFIIFGGFKYMTSGDNSSGIAAAQKTILNAVIGLVLSIMSVALVTFVANAIGS